MTHSSCASIRSPAIKGSSRGFTVIEVLIATTLMMIGAAAVMSMQKASIQGNLEARKTDVANAIARTWVERLRRDAMQWTQIPGGGTNFAVSRLLGHVGAGWVLPADYLNVTAPETMSYGFDILGRDLPQGAIVGTAIFCVNIRETWLTQNQLVRADVRVIWPRAITSAPAGFCTAALGNNPEAGASAGAGPTYHAIYVTTAIAPNPAQNPAQ